MTSLLPTDLEIEQRLVPVRTAVLDATRTVRSPVRSTRFRTTRNLIIAGAAIAALTAGAWVVAQASQNYIDTSIVCYEHASLDSQQQAIQNAEPIDPIDACTFVWQEHSFDPGGGDEPGDPGEGTGTVPELIVCSNPDGSAAVFPREGRPAEDFCETLGLAEWDSD